MDKLPEMPTIEQRREADKERRGGAIPLFGRSAKSGFSFGSRAVADLLGRSSWLGGIFASNIGPALCLGLMLTTAAGGAGMLFHLTNSAAASDAAKKSSRILDAVGPSGIVINGPRNKSLNFVTNANRGEIQFDQASKKPAEVQAPREKKVRAKKDPGTDLAALLAKGGKGSLNGARDGFVRKMTKDTKELHGGRFGSMSGGFGSFNGNSLITKDRIGNAAPQFGGRAGNLERMSRNKSSMSASAKSTSRIKTASAKGQLAFARAMSGKGMSSSAAGRAESSAQYASDAFDQQSTHGGVPTQGPIGLASGAQPIVAPVGSGAPDVTASGGAPASQGYGEYKPLMDQAGQLGSQASDMKQMAIMFLILGAALIALGATMTFLGIGGIIIALGVALVGMGVMQMLQSNKMADQADKIGQQIQDTYKQQDQGQAVRDCSKVAADGGNYDSCLENKQLPPEAANTAPQSKPDDFQYKEEAPEASE